MAFAHSQSFLGQEQKETAMWKGRGYYGGGEGKATEAEMKIQVNVHATEVFIFIRDSRYSPEIERSENAIYLSKDQAKEFAEDLLRRLSKEEV